MEELDFFEEICLTSLYATKAVKFQLSLILMEKW